MKICSEHESDKDGSCGPLVSVIVPTHNRPELLQRALQSLAGQEYHNWEAVVVNDAGVDVRTVAESVDPGGRIRYVVHDTNRGLSAARNTGLTQARGEIVCYLDDDDLFQRDHLATVVNGLKQGARFVYTDAEYKVERWQQGRSVRCVVGNPYAHEQFSREKLHVRNYIPVNTWAHRADLVSEIGGFDESLSALEDWDFLLRASRVVDLLHIPRTTVEVHLRESEGDNMTTRERDNLPGLYRELYQRYDPLGSERIRSAREQVLRDLEGGRPAAEAEQGNGGCHEDSYARWLQKQYLSEADATIMAERMAKRWVIRPRVRFVTEYRPGEEERLAATLESLGNQLYKQWELIVISDQGCPDPSLMPSSRVEWRVKTVGESWADAANAALNQPGSDWVGVLCPGDELAVYALLSFGDYINARRTWKGIYCDDDVLGADGERTQPRFKPDLNLELLRSTDYVGFCLFQRDALVASGGFGSRVSAVYDAVFKLVETFGEPCIGHVADVLYHRHENNVSSDTDEVRATSEQQSVDQHLARIGVNAGVFRGWRAGTRFVEYFHGRKPSVTVIVPTRDRLEVLKPCTESLLEKTEYPNYELIIVDNDSREPETLSFLSELERRHDRVQVLQHPGEFNFSAINNRAVRRARGEYLLFLNNDTEVIHGSWLDRMMSYGRRQDVGAVGARLLYDNEAIQHVGVTLGVSDVADHVGIDRPCDEPGPMNRYQVSQELSAVTGGCMLMNKELFLEAGGFDEQDFPVFFNDVDLCLKIREKGYRVIWTPLATLVHRGSQSLADEQRRPQSAQQLRDGSHRMLARWLPQLVRDPAYNRNLSLVHRDGRPESDVVAHWNPDFRDRPRVLAFPVDVSGSPRYRVLNPLLTLEREARIQLGIMPEHRRMRIPNVSELVRLDPDVLLLQAFMHNWQLQALDNWRRYSRAARVFALDDLFTEIPEKSPKFKENYPDIERRLRAAMAASDRLVVSTEVLKDKYGAWSNDVVVVPNHLERGRWGNLDSKRRVGAKPRVGWAGAQQHHGDLQILVDVVKATADEVDWVFMGMWLDELVPYAAELREAVPFEQYPAALAGMNLDLAVAPLEYHPFNEAKSNLRLLEYGVFGWPVVCTDIEPYKEAPVCRVPNRTQAWIEAIRARVYDLDAAEREGDRLREWVWSQWMLDDHLDDWMDALFLLDRSSPVLKTSGGAV